MNKMERLCSDLDVVQAKIGVYREEQHTVITNARLQQISSKLNDLYAEAGRLKRLITQLEDCECTDSLDENRQCMECGRVW